MTKTFCLLLPVLALVLVGCGGGGGEGQAGAAEYVAVAEELNTLLDGVNDAGSAKAAAPKVRELTARAKAARAKVAPAGGGSGAPQLSGLEGRVDTAMQRILDDRSRINGSNDLRAQIGKDIDDFVAAWSGAPLGPTI